MIDVVKRSDILNFRRMLHAGLSPNACNAHGESLLHMICRRGNLPLFRVLLDNATAASGASVDLQVADDYGRTPMHDCCWASTPSFEIAKYLLETDVTLLFLRDARGSLPLQYVAKSNWGMWNKFLEDFVLEKLFPEHDGSRGQHKNSLAKDNGSANRDFGIPTLCLQEPDSRPVRDPKHCIPASLANMVATGTMHPYEVMLAMTAFEVDETVLDTKSECDDSDKYDSDGYSSDDDDSSSGEERADLYGCAGKQQPQQQSQPDVEIHEIINGTFTGETTDTDGECLSTDEGADTDDGENTTTDYSNDDVSSYADGSDVDEIIGLVESIGLAR